MLACILARFQLRAPNAGVYWQPAYVWSNSAEPQDALCSRTNKTRRSTRAKDLRYSAKAWNVFWFWRQSLQSSRPFDSPFCLARVDRLRGDQGSHGFAREAQGRCGRGYARCEAKKVRGGGVSGWPERARARGSRAMPRPYLFFLPPGRHPRQATRRFIRSQKKPNRSDNPRPVRNIPRAGGLSFTPQPFSRSCANPWRAQRPRRSGGIPGRGVSRRCGGRVP